MLPSTDAHVPDQSAQHINKQIRRRMEERIARLAAGPEPITRRLEELDREAIDYKDEPAQCGGTVWWPLFVGD